MVVVEGEDRESLPVGSGGVALVVVGVLPISRRRVISHSRSSGATRRRDGDEEEQQQREKPRQDRQAGTGAAPQQHSHVCRRSVGRYERRARLLDPVGKVTAVEKGREASASRNREARTFTHELPRHVQLAHSS